ncbi:MAG TPA: ABC transporter permease [Gemmatimonadaceae bacterium]|nr:ABC transporter permease [Gemmatimonadaceae bacterium]
MRFAQIIRAAIRSVLRRPAFAAGIAIVLALGIGLATAVFSVADAVILRKLSVADQDRIALLWGVKRDGTAGAFPLTLDQARSIGADSRALAGVAFHTYEGATQELVRDGNQVSRLRRARVSGNFFTVLGARPAAGRLLRESDDVTGAAPVAVLSHDAWTRRFGGDPSVVGKRLDLHKDGIAYEIVGVMAPGLDYPRGADFWASTYATVPHANLPYVAVNLVGRLAPGASLAAAGEELTNHFASPAASPWQRDLIGSAHTLPEVVLGNVDDAVIIFAIAAALLLLITCINVANLLLVRGVARHREIAVRAAIGASRSSIVAQLMAENAVLALLGGIIALPVAAAAVASFIAFAPSSVPRLGEITLNGSTLLAAFGITVVAVLVFGVLPAALASRHRSIDALRSGARESGSRGSRRLTELLVAGQVALAFTIVAAAGLMTRSLVRLQGEDLAFNPAGMAIAELALSSRDYDAAPKQLAMLEQLLPAVRSLPGVRAATSIVAVPFSGTHGWDGRFGAEGQTTADVAKNPMLNMELVAPGHFAMFGVTLLHGRAINDDDRAGATPVAVISESTAQHYWPGESAVGRRLFLGTPDRSVTIVGVVSDTRWRDLRQERATVYIPMRQSFFPFAPTTLAIRSDASAATLTPALRALLQREFPGVALAAVAPFDDFLARPLAEPRMNAFLLTVFAVAALALAAIGIFGVMMLSVTQRTRELGVRLALGATPAMLRRMVLRRGGTVAAAGTLAGIAGALLLNRALASLLYEVSSNDMLTLALVAAFTLLVALVATAIPARASTRVDPVRALRSDG